MSDSPSSGERTGRSPNRWSAEGGSRCFVGVGGIVRRGLPARRVAGVGSRTWLERRAGAGESPVGVTARGIWGGHLSRPGHGKSWLKRAGPSAKAKYEPVTDSGPVP